MSPIGRQGSWEPGWQERLYKLLSNAGFCTATEFANHMPTATFVELAKKLNDQVVPLHLQWILNQEAIEQGRMTCFARRLFANYIRRAMPSGWDSGGDPQFERSHAFSSWKSDMDDAYDVLADRVWAAFKSDPPPRGWLPSGPDDPILLRAFEGISFDSDS